MSSLQQTAYNAILGALVGDALGVPFEFKPGHDIPPAETIEMVMPYDYPKTYSGVPYGVWSDDGSLTLCLLESLLKHKGEFVRTDFENLVSSWYYEGRHQYGGRPFDCGGAIRHAIVSEYGAKQPLSNSAGNGSLMRTLPVALVGAIYNQSQECIAQNAFEQSLTTHANLLPAACCVIHTLLAHQLIQTPAISIQDSLGDAFAAAATIGKRIGGEALLGAINAVCAYKVSEIPNGSGHAANSFWSAVSSLTHGDSYREVVRYAISLGNDTDTTACIAGGLAGIIWGIGDEKGIPLQWANELKMPARSIGILDALMSSDN